MTADVAPAVRFGWTLIADEHAAPQPGDLTVIATASGNLLQEVVRLSDKALSTCSPVNGGALRSFSLGSVTARTVIALLAPEPGWSAIDDRPGIDP